MPIRTHLGVHKKAIEESEAARKRVMVRRGRLVEIMERPIAVSFGHVAEHLIVSAILFDDVDDVLERRILRGGAAYIPAVRFGDTLRERIEIGNILGE